MSFLGPDFLVRRIDLIALVVSAVFLVFFADTINRNLVFPISDFIKEKAKSSFNKRFILKYLPDILATLIFILYCYFGTIIVAEYVLAPILSNLHSILLIVVIALFFAIAYVINNHSLRRKFLNA